MSSAWVPSFPSSLTVGIAVIDWSPPGVRPALDPRLGLSHLPSVMPVERLGHSAITRVLSRGPEQKGASSGRD